MKIKDAVTKNEAIICLKIMISANSRIGPLKSTFLSNQLFYSGSASKWQRKMGHDNFFFKKYNIFFWLFSPYMLDHHHHRQKRTSVFANKHDFSRILPLKSIIFIDFSVVYRYLQRKMGHDIFFFFKHIQFFLLFSQFLGQKITIFQ